MSSALTQDEALKYFGEKKTAYQLALGSPAGKAVLADLTTFCRGKESCFHPDPRLHAVLEGRREVYLRLMQFLELTPEELIPLNTRPAKGAISHGRSDDDRDG
jgi:hypothetical protein